MKALTRHDKIDRKGPVVLIILDGVGINEKETGNAYRMARTPLLDELTQNSMFRTLRAHGTAVGLPSDDDMGNSEVGHNALGAGRIFEQGAKLVSAAIDQGSIFTTPTWKSLLEKPVKEKTALHFIGLLSDGNVHSHIKHLFKMLDKAAEEGVENCFVHILLDGRDVPETSCPIYIEQLENHLKTFNDKGLNYKIASGGGRMVTTMDRYGADWDIVKRGWDAHVLGKARAFSNAMEAIETFRKEDNGIADQYLPSFTITDKNKAIGPVNDGDSVIFFNFRGDRSIEITRAFEEKDFSKFDRERHPKIFYAGMMQYDGDLKIPKNYLVLPPSIDKTMSEYLAKSGVTQYAISETQKFGHVTYFWNGNKSGMFDKKTETYKEIPSDKLEFNERPWMKAAEITDEVIEAIESGTHDFIRLNFANGDMVGHTGDLDATIIAAETLDLCLKRLLEVIERSKAIALITADHGNLDEMFELNKKSGEIMMNKETGLPSPKTSHTLNPVPMIIYDPEYNNEYYLDENQKDAGIGNIAATLMNLLGFNPPEDYLPSIIKLK
jgi:2,3-bisphosphoglycerate-independent phosphoglycerate mutase